MTLLKKHFKKSNSWMYISLAKHDGYGLIPRLRVNRNEEVYIYFEFTWWKFHWYWVGKRK